MSKMKRLLDLIDDLRFIAEERGAPKGSDATTTGKFIWEKGDTSDIALAARTCGRLEVQVESEGVDPALVIEPDATDTLHDWIWCINPMRAE